MGKMRCSHCDKEFEVRDGRRAVDAPTHNFPVISRAVCRGSGKRMKRNGDRPTPERQKGGSTTTAAPPDKGRATPR